MKNLTRRNFGKLALTSSALALAGVNPLSAAGRIRHYWWGNKERDKRTYATIDAFNQAFSDSTVVGETLGWSDYWTKMATQVAGKNMADVIQMDYRYIAEYARRGAIKSLNPHLDSGAINMKDFSQFSFDGGTVDGQLYGINIGTNSQFVPYDKTLLDQLGLKIDPYNWTWDDYVKISKEVTKNTPDGVYGAVNSGGTETWLELWLRQKNKALYHENGDLAFDQKDVEDYWTFWMECQESGVTWPAAEQTAATSMAQSGVPSKKTAFDAYWTNQIVAIQALTDHQIEMATFPHNSGDSPGMYYKCGQFISLSRDSTDDDLSAKYMNFFIRDPRAVGILKLERGVPGTKEMRDFLKPGYSREEAIMVDYLENIESRTKKLPPVPPKGAGEISKAFTRYWEGVSFGKTSVASAARSFYREAGRIRRQQG
jgi:multiple sugar transport system substrate-binding protein